MHRFDSKWYRLGLAIAFVLALSAGLAIFGATSFASVPASKASVVLHLRDKVIVTADGCLLDVPVQRMDQITIRCKTSLGSETSHAINSKTKVVLQPQDKVVFTASGCALRLSLPQPWRFVVQCVVPPPTAGTPTPTPTQAATPTPSSDWLAYVNQARALAALPAVNENSSWSSGDVLHSKYMVKNNIIAHAEDPSKPYYTAAGNTAAQNSDLFVSSSTGTTDREAIADWLAGPFHAVGILDPGLNTTGYGSYREVKSGFQMGAGLDVLRGLGDAPSSVTYPVMFPAPGKTTWLTQYGGGEGPDPLSSCSGYQAPTGPPILLQIGHGNLTPHVTAHSFKQGTTALAHCLYDQTSYSNTNADLQSLGRAVLAARNAIVLMPRAPLVTGKTYSVSITTNGQTNTWSFAVGSVAQQSSPVDPQVR